MCAAGLALEKLPPAELAAYYHRKLWLDEANAPERGGKQLPPPDRSWDQLIFKSGRGFGKTRAQIEWLWWELWKLPGTIGHAVAPTLFDLRGTLFEGPAGFKHVIPSECLKGGSWEIGCNKTHSEIYLSNGSMIRGFGAQDEGGRLRGPQCHRAIGDELREWDKPAGNLAAVHHNLMYGLRMKSPDNSPARAVFGTTPKSIPYLKALYKAPGVKVVSGSTYENVQNLDAAFARRILGQEGTKIGRVEIHAEDIEEEETAILKRSWFRLWPAVKKLPEFSFVLMSLDTAFEEEDFDRKKQEPDYSCCGIWGVFNIHAAFDESERKRLRLNNRYGAVLCDFWMERLSFPDLCEKTREGRRVKWGSPGRFPDVVLIENKGSGISLRQTMQRYGVPTWPFNPGRQDKTMRIHAASPYVLQGNIFVPESKQDALRGQVRTWAEPMMSQVCAYSGPGSTEFDDAVDMLSMSVIYLSQKGVFELKSERRPAPDPDEVNEQKKREAVAQRDREKASVNPYFN